MCRNCIIKSRAGRNSRPPHCGRLRLPFCIYSLLIHVLVLLTANTAASADMQEENRHSSAICAVVIMFSAIAADSAVEMNTGAAFEKTTGTLPHREPPKEAHG